MSHSILNRVILLLIQPQEWSVLNFQLFNYHCMIFPDWARILRSPMRRPRPQTWTSMLVSYIRHSSRPRPVERLRRGLCLSPSKYEGLITARYRYNAANFKNILTSNMTIAKGTHCPHMNPQQTPHVPPLRACHGTSTLCYMDKICRVISIFDCIYI